MNKNNPIIVIEDDMDDQEFFQVAFANLGYKNKLYFFQKGDRAMDFLLNSGIEPFLIISDINLPKFTGLAIREKLRLDAKLQLKAIPYIFFSTGASKDAVTQAYSLSAQGFFKKENSIGELEATIQVIMEYWKRCIAPHDFST